MIKNFPTIKQRVIEICEKYPECKGNYNLLVTRYHWYYYHRGFGITFEELLSLPNGETIGRAFRKCIEKGQIEPTRRILEMRARRQAKFRDMMTENNSNYVARERE